MPQNERFFRFAAIGAGRVAPAIGEVRGLYDQDSQRVFRIADAN
jgi:hypothetical protein